MTLPVEDPRGLLKEIGQIPAQAQIGCLETTVARLESDLSAMKARAGAWAVGDVDALRKLPLPDQQGLPGGTVEFRAFQGFERQDGAGLDAGSAGGTGDK